MKDFQPKPGEQFLALVNGRWHHAEIRGGHPGDVFLLTQSPVTAVQDYAVQRMAPLPDVAASKLAAERELVGKLAEALQAAYDEGPRWGREEWVNFMMSARRALEAFRALEAAPEAEDTIRKAREK